MQGMVGSLCLWGWGSVEGWQSGMHSFANRKGAGKEPMNSCFLLHLASLEAAVCQGVRRPGFWCQFCHRGTA